MITLLNVMILVTYIAGALVVARSEYVDNKRCTTTRTASKRVHSSDCYLSPKYAGSDNCDCTCPWLKSIFWPLWFTLVVLVIACCWYVTRPVRIPDHSHVKELEQELGMTIDEYGNEIK